MFTIPSGFKKTVMLGLLGCTLLAMVPSTSASPNLHVCFTPGNNCTGQLIQILNYARKSILVQAYSFTSIPIAKSLMDAQKRGVDVRVILDKSQCHEKNSAINRLGPWTIPTWIDVKPAIAHNKVMIVDGQKVVTGSFNFTKAAQDRNAENLLIITDSALAKLYINNWYHRLGKSVTYCPSSSPRAFFRN